MGTIYEDLEALTDRVEALENQLTQEDSGWIALPLADGVLAYNDSLTPKYRKIGNEVFLNGVVKNITAANTILGTLPEGFRPPRQQYFIGGSATISSGEATFYNCQVNSDGNIRITTHSTGTYNQNYYLRLNGSFLID